MARGPDAEAVRNEGEARLSAAAKARMRIGGVIPVNALSGAIYGAGVTRAWIDAPAADIEAGDYAIPVLGDVSLDVEAAT